MEEEGDFYALEWRYEDQEEGEQQLESVGGEREPDPTQNWNVEDAVKYMELVGTLLLCGHGM